MGEVSFPQTLALPSPTASIEFRSSRMFEQGFSVLPAPDTIEYKMGKIFGEIKNRKEPC